MRMQRTILVAFLDLTIVCSSWSAGLHPLQVHPTTLSYPQILFFKTYVAFKLGAAVPSYNTSQLVQLQPSGSLLSKSVWVALQPGPV